MPALYYVFLILVTCISRFGFEGRIWVPFALVPGHCLLFHFKQVYKVFVSTQKKEKKSVYPCETQLDHIKMRFEGV